MDNFHDTRHGYEKNDLRACVLIEVYRLSHSDTHLLVWGVMQMLHVHDLVLTIVKQVRGSSRAPSTPTAYRTILIAFLGEFRTYEIYLTTIEHDPMHMMRYSHPDHDSAVLALIGSINGNKSNAA